MSWQPPGFSNPPGWQPPGWQPGTESASATAVLSGTAVIGMIEFELPLGGKTIIITLDNDTFVAAGTGPIGSSAVSLSLLAGITSDQSEASGWNAEVRDNLAVTNLVRTSDTVATVTLPASADYDITADERIVVTIPGAALTGAAAVVASNVLTVIASDSGIPSSTFSIYAPTNSDAQAVPSQYNICDRSGFRGSAGALIKEWTGVRVLPRFSERRNPQDFVRVPPENRYPSPERPEQTDKFIGTDVYSSGVSSSDL